MFKSKNLTRCPQLRMSEHWALITQAYAPQIQLNRQRTGPSDLPTETRRPVSSQWVDQMDVSH
jgi:hypothetical protein